MGFWRSVDMEWKGKTYTVTPTFDLLSRIEKRGDLSIMRVTADAVSGNPQATKMALILAMLLREGGAEDVSVDEIAASIMRGKNKAAALYHAVQEALIPQFPEDDEAGNAESEAAA